MDNGRCLEPRVMGRVVNCAASLWRSVTTLSLLMEVSLVTVTTAWVIACNAPSTWVIVQRCARGLPANHIAPARTPHRTGNAIE